MRTTNTKIIKQEEFLKLTEVEPNLIIHGDAFTCMKKLKDSSVSLILTDPNYSMKGKKVTDNNWDKPFDLELFFEESFRVLKKGCPLIVFGADPFVSELIHTGKQYFRWRWTWLKESAGNFMMAKKRPLKRIEFACVFSLEPNPNYYPIMRTGDHIKSYTKRCIVNTGQNFKSNLKSYERSSEAVRYPIDLLEFAKPHNKHCLHPTEKPVELLKYLSSSHLQSTEENPRPLVLDCFAGSCSTMQASYELGFDALCIEQEERYVQAGENRINSLK